MGWKRSELTPGVLAAMSAQDQARYATSVAVSNTPKSDNSESKIQSDFAAVCLEKGWRPVWNVVHKRSTATRGSPDFGVMAYGQTFWIEFKIPEGELSPIQKLFHRQAADNGVTVHVCHSWQEAVDLIEKEPPFSGQTLEIPRTADK